MTKTDELLQEKIIAYEWHNEATGHCYVDYIAHSSMDEINGYKKIPLYKGEDVNFAIGHGLDRLINQEVEERIAERMPSEKEAINYAADYATFLDDMDEPHVDIEKMDSFLHGERWLRNRMKGNN